MKTVKLLLLLLLPAALFFASCQNELPPETFLIEENSYTAGDPDRYRLSDVDYFVLDILKWNPANSLPVATPEEPVKSDIRLERGDILRLGGLEPGYYRILGEAYKINENYDPDLYEVMNYAPQYAQFIRVGTVEGKSDRMHQFAGNSSKYIIVETGVPVIVRFIFTGENDNL